jgi:DNA-binding response OmpR family regulator
MSDPIARIAVINTSVELVNLLQELFEMEGFAVVTAFTLDFKQGRVDFPTFCATHQPAVVVYDIALPYEENWQFFHAHILETHALSASRFVLTTVNKTILEALVGPTPALELVGKPFDLDLLLQAVKAKAHGA